MKSVFLAVAAVSFSAFAESGWQLRFTLPGETNVVSLGSSETKVDRLVANGREYAISVDIRARRNADGGLSWTGTVVNGEPQAVVEQLAYTPDPYKVVRGKTALYFPQSLGIRIRNFPKKDTKMRPLRPHERDEMQIAAPTQEEFLTGKLKDEFPWRPLGGGKFVFIVFDTYPSLHMQMQWMAMCEKDHCSYFISRDEQIRPKTFSFVFDANTDELFYRLKLPMSLRCGETYDLPPVDFNTEKGDWKVPAKKYRQWWDTCHRLAKIGDQDRDMVGFFEFILEQQNCRMIQYPYTDFPKLGDVALSHGIHHIEFHGWHRGGHDTNYPVYDADERMGGEVALRRGLANLQKRGLRVAAYFNGQLIDIGDDATGMQNTTEWRRRHGDRCALVRRDGTAFPEHWNKFKDTNGHYFYRACMGSPEWYEQMLKVSFQAKAYGYNGLFFDQMGTSAPKWCYSSEHSHRPGDLVWCADRVQFFNKLLSEVRDAYPDTVLLAEGWNDTINESTLICQGNGHGTSGENIVWRFDDEHFAEMFPEMLFYTFPELIYTDRFHSPYATRNRVNATAATNLRIDLESRYVPDRGYCESGIRPATNAYDLMCHAPIEQISGYWTEDWAQNRDYLRMVCDFRRANRDLLLRGRFVADEGFELKGGTKIIANRWIGADGQSGILVWNGDSKPADVDVACAGRLVSVTEPERGQVDPGTPIPANSLRFFRYE